MEIVPQLIANSIIAGSIYTILALGFNLVFSMTKFVDIGFGTLTVIGGYTVFLFSKILGVPLPLGILLGLVISGLVNFLVYLFVYKPLRARKASGAVLLIASLGVITAIQAFIAMFFSSQFQSLSGLLAGNRVFDIFGGVMTAVQLSTLALAILLFFALGLTLKYTLFGKAITAISDDEEVSKIVGLNTEKIIGSVFFLAGAIGGLGGMLIGFDTGIEPIMGLPWLLSGVTAAIIGGIGNVYGSAAGGLLLALAENFGIWHIAGEWKSAITFGLLIVFLLWRPKGLFPR